MGTTDMIRMEPFAVEQWMVDYETKARFNIAETCASVSIEDLQTLSESKPQSPLSMSTEMNYGPIRGSEKLRSALSNLYSVEAVLPLPKENILVTPGAVAANFLIFYTLVRAGDHVICHFPTYQPLYSVPRSLGAEVSLWKVQSGNRWQLEIEELKSLIKPNTRMIVINNPNNPTGAITSRPLLEHIVEIVKAHDLIIFSDEVYRPLFHSISPTDPSFPPSILSFAYPKTIATGSLSKAYSLAGIRVGWIASRSTDIIEACAQARQYTNISVSRLDDQVASYALGPDCIHVLLDRSIQLAKVNLAILERFVEQHRGACEWVKPMAGTTSFVKFTREGKAVDDVAFCKMLMQTKGVLFCPGSICFGEGNEFKGYVRMGYLCKTEVLKRGLEELGDFIMQNWQNVPTAL